MPPAIEAIAGAPDTQVDAFLAAGHVCTVYGHPAVRTARRAWYRVPIVVTGFEPLDVLEGLCAGRCASSRRAGAEVENAYERAVRPDGNERPLGR